MKWEEVRKIYPNRFVKIQILDFHIENNVRYIDDMAVVQAFEDDPKGYINGLLGLDLLMKLGAVLDLKRLSLTLDAS